jgi:hypothetical protein
LSLAGEAVFLCDFAFVIGEETFLFFVAENARMRGKMRGIGERDIL